MSEPSQLFARLHISRAKFEEFLASPFRIEVDDALMAWLDQAEYYGPRFTRESVRDRATSYATVREWVDDMVAPGIMGFPTPHRNRYDDQAQTWTLAALDFSENYDDYIAAAGVMREAARYKDRPGDDGLVVYGFIFGNGYSFALEVGEGRSKFLSEDEAASLVAQAERVIDELMAEGAAMAGEDA